MDSERAIEKLLRLAARKRRGECKEPFALHPATRQMLQGEVTREFRSRGARWRAFPRVLARLWPRFALAAGIVLVLGAITWVFVPARQGDSKTLAWKKERASEPALAGRPRPAEHTVDKASEQGAAPAASLGVAQNPTRNEPAPAAQNAVAPSTPPPAPPVAATMDEQRLAKSVTPSEAPALLAERDKTLSAPEPVDRNLVPAAAAPGQPSATAAPAQRFGLDQAGTAARSARDPGGVGGSREATAPGSAGGLAGFAAGTTAPATGGLLDASAYRRREAPLPEKQAAAEPTRLIAGEGVLPQAQQSFKMIATPGTRKLKAPTDEAPTSGRPPGVLASFALQQSGNRLQVIDADGSIYSGTVQVPQATGTPPTAGLPLARSQAVGGKLPLADSFKASFQYAFRVVGTNRTLNQKVEFSGKLVPLTNASAAVTTNAAPASVTAEAKEGAALALPLSKSQISGRLRVNGREEAVEAVPAK